MLITTFSIPTFRKQSVSRRLDKLVKKAAKYGNPDIGYSFGATRIEEVVTDSGPCKVEYIDINVYGEAPKIGDWQLLARVEIAKNLSENLIHTVPGSDIQLDSGYRTHDGHCDHCNTNRPRNDVYVLTDGDTQIAVGRTCLRDFLGIDDPKAIVSRAQFFEEIRSFEADDELDFRGASIFLLKEILSVSAASIREVGYVSRARANETGGETTGEFVKGNQCGYRGYDIEVTEEDRIWAEKTIEFFRSTDQFDNDYMNNIRVLMETDIVDLKHIALIASAVITVQRALAPKQETKESNFIGEVKQRLKGLTLILDRIIYLGSGYYGSSYLHLFKDSDGNAFSWVTGNKMMIAEGTTINVDATVKQHKEYKGTKQTVLTRAKMIA
jgi:hypothetical protein